MTQIEDVAGKVSADVHVQSTRLQDLMETQLAYVSTAESLRWR